MKYRVLRPSRGLPGVGATVGPGDVEPWRLGTLVRSGVLAPVRKPSRRKTSAPPPAPDAADPADGQG